MEAAEELVKAAPPPPSGHHKDLSPIAKGKRTKRLRPHSPIPFTIATPTHNSTAGNDDRHHHWPSPTASADGSTTTEEADTARCLILLSLGQFPSTPLNLSNNLSNSNMQAVYTCKTCNRSFPSFQALGGHRASHKKPKNEKRATTSMLSDEEDFPSPPYRNKFSLNSRSLQLNNNASTTTAPAFSQALVNKSLPSPRMHECSYCGAEFTSGQALGGHMRKHRAWPIIRSTEFAQPGHSVEDVEHRDSRKPEINLGLTLDLNLPAPKDEKEKSPKESEPRSWFWLQ